MATYYSTTVASSQGTAFDNQFRAPAGLQHGRIRVAMGSAASTSSSLTTAGGDIFALATLRGTDRLIAAFSFGDGLEGTGGQIFDVGLYKKNNNGTVGAVASIACFDADAAEGVTAGHVFGIGGAASAGKQMWEVAGAASEAAGEDAYFLAITMDSSNGVLDVANWRIGASVLYTSGD